MSPNCPRSPDGDRVPSTASPMAVGSFWAYGVKQRSECGYMR
ncbi:MAG: hypothetical protein ACRC62_15670 [Microcoleus sp.]